MSSSWVNPVQQQQYVPPPSQQQQQQNRYTADYDQLQHEYAKVSAELAQSHAALSEARKKDAFQDMKIKQLQSLLEQKTKRRRNSSETITISSDSEGDKKKRKKRNKKKRRRARSSSSSSSDSNSTGLGNKKQKRKPAKREDSQSPKRSRRRDEDDRSREREPHQQPRDLHPYANAPSRDREDRGRALSPRGRGNTTAPTNRHRDSSDDSSWSKDELRLPNERNDRQRPTLRANPRYGARDVDNRTRQLAKDGLPPSPLLSQRHNAPRDYWNSADRDDRRIGYDTNDKDRRTPKKGSIELLSAKDCKDTPQKAARNGVLRNGGNPRIVLKSRSRSRPSGGSSGKNLDDGGAKVWSTALESTLKNRRS